MPFSIYIHKPKSTDWIIERLMSDICKELNFRGLNVRCGDYCDYNGEEVLLHSRFLTARYDKRAKVNSLFVTHIDDYARECEVKLQCKKFNSFVCLSEHDANFLYGLIGVSHNVVGIDLPCRDIFVRSLRICVFSRGYNDNRKNEHWLLEYFTANSSETDKNIILVLLGCGWENFASKLADLDVPYELYSYPSWVRNEYQMYKDHLSQCDLLIYMGTDGGQMSVYDGLQSGIEMVFPNLSYHKNLSDHIFLYDTKNDFFSIIKSKIERRIQNQKDLQSRSIQMYCDKLYRHWEVIIDGSQQTSNCHELPISKDISDAVKTFKSNYKPLTYNRVRSFLIRCLNFF